MTSRQSVFRVKESVHVRAPIDRCFLLSTSVPLVERILGLKPRSGKTAGFVEDGDRVLWKGWKFGLPVSHETLITGYDRPHFFQDSMASGWFESFQHDHRFSEVDGHTLLVDVVRFSLPFGPAGKQVAKRIMVPHVLGLMVARFELLKRIAEGDDWEKYLCPSAAAARSSESLP